MLCWPLPGEWGFASHSAKSLPSVPLVFQGWKVKHLRRRRWHFSEKAPNSQFGKCYVISASVFKSVSLSFRLYSVLTTSLVEPVIPHGISDPSLSLSPPPLASFSLHSFSISPQRSTAWAVLCMYYWFEFMYLLIGDYNILFLSPLTQAISWYECLCLPLPNSCIEI